MPIIYITGDATKPVRNGNRIIVHCCNDRGFWNAGFVRALSKRWPQPEHAYRQWAQGRTRMPFRLGQVQFVNIEPGLCVANLIGQAGIRSHSNPIPLRYDALREGLARVQKLALNHDASIHMPRIGARLAGGNWQTISEIIESELCTHGLCVTVYDLPPGTSRRQ